MPFTTLLEKGLLGLEFGDVAYTPPATHEVGLIAAATWTATTVVATGAYGVPTAFVGTGASLGKLFKATTGGTTGSTQPTWPTTAGGTVVDGTVTWTEVSTLFAAGTITGAEPSTSGTGYGRATGITNSSGSWNAAAGGDPANVTNVGTISFGTTTATWGQLVGGLILDATGTNLHAWGLLPAVSEVATVVGTTPQIAPGALTLTLT